MQNSKSFIEFSRKIENVYENSEDYNPAEKRKKLILFDDLIADM